MRGCETPILPLSGYSVTSSDAARRDDHHGPRPAKLVRALLGPVGKQTTSPRRSSRSPSASRSVGVPVQDDQPTPRSRDGSGTGTSLAVGKLVDRGADLPAADRLPDPRAAPAVPVALRRMVELGREDVRPLHTRSLLKPERRRRGRARSVEPPRDLRMPTLAVEQHGAASRRPARPRCPRAACRRPSRACRRSTSSSSSIARKIDSCGFVFPCACEVSTASASSP